jgi:hypothetical protein
MSPLRATVTREQLYAQVWNEPMVVVAQRYGVSSNYLARVCEHMNVPCPPRGYWAKERVGRAPGRPSLAESRPGEVVTWTKGDHVPRRVNKATPLNTDEVAALRRDASQAPLGRHVLVAGARELFEGGRISDEGYLRPLKRNLVDLLTSKDTLAYALDAVSQCLQIVEARGHRVTLSTDATFRRPELALYKGQIFDHRNGELWRPGRLTVVFIGQIAFGLSFYEYSEEAEVTYNWDTPVRYQKAAHEPPPKRRPRYSRERPTYRRQMPSGRLALRAYSPYVGVSWERHWQEVTCGDLVDIFADVLTALETAVDSIATLRAEAKERAEIQRREWEHERREHERLAREQRRTDARRDSRQQLLSIVANWSQARTIERFFSYAKRHAAHLPPDAQVDILARLDSARRLLGGVDPLGHFEGWQSPNQLLRPEDYDETDT